MKKKLLILLLSIGFISNAFADRFIFNGDTLHLVEKPLYSLYGNSISTILKEVMCRVFDGEECIAYWTVIEQQLYLTAIVNGCDRSIKADLKELFGNKFIDGKVKADWVTQSLFAGKDVVVSTMEGAFYMTELELNEENIYGNIGLCQLHLVRNLETNMLKMKKKNELF
jgi:hypothetical protein